MTTTVPTVRKRRSRRLLPRTILLYAVPALVVYAFVVIVPTLQGGMYAFTDWDGLNPDYKFVGVKNVVAVLQDPQAQRSLINTVVIAIAFTVIQNILGLFLAMAVNSKIKTRNFLRVLIFAPAVMTPVVVGYLWQYMLSPDGPVNTMLRSIGLGAFAQTWLGDPTLAVCSIIFILIWQFAGYSMVIFIAGLQAIPEELLEAAAVDGAGPVRRFFNIILPLIAPAITINVMLSMIGSLKLFDQVWSLTGGGPGGLTNTLTTLMFREAFTFGDFGKAVSLGLLLLLIVAAISVIQYRALIARELR